MGTVWAKAIDYLITLDWFSFVLQYIKMLHFQEEVQPRSMPVATGMTETGNKILETRRCDGTAV